MGITLKKRIISGFTVISLIASTFASAVPAFGEEEVESNLYEVMSEATDTAEVTVFSSSDVSEVVCATETDAVIETVEGIEVLENYTISDREEGTDETLWIKAEQDESVVLQPEESMSIYSVEDNGIADLIIENIAEENDLCEIDSEVTGLALVKDSGYRHLNFELESVSLDGMMPKNAVAEAYDVTEIYSDAADYSSVTDASSTDASLSSSEEIIAAYDITIRNGEDEYQPSSDRPIAVTITNPGISTDADLTLWHIMDDGTREEVNDFTAEEGKVSFNAFGFSVYEIVEGIPSTIDVGWQKLKSIADIQTYLEQGIYICSETKRFVTNYQTQVTDSRTGITKTKGTYDVIEGSEFNSNGAVTSSEPYNAVPYYFEDFTVSTSNNKEGTAKIYCFGTNGLKKYIKNDPADSMKFVNDPADADIFTIKLTDATNGKFSLKGKTNYLNEQSGSGWGSGDGVDGGKKSFTGYNSATNMYLYVYNDIPKDGYQLDGNTFGLMYYDNTPTGSALMAEGDGNVSSLMTNVIRTTSGSKTISKTVFIVDEDVTSWTFHAIDENKYYLSASIGSDVKYLTITDSNITLSDTADNASEFSVIPDSDGKIKLSSNGNYIIFDGTSFKVGTDASKAGLNFIDISDISLTDKMTYSATKISVSEVKDGDDVIVYTRIWNGDKKEYEFYAIDHDGSLFKCYERGDNIMWVGSPLNSFLWDFTEYTYDDGTPNYYYELQNIYSEKYIAPQITDGQILSDSTLGINMQGRKSGEYYSAIRAWDNANYAYASLVAVKEGDNAYLESIPTGNPSTFYFAKISDVVPDLTKVETLDNDQYGITMKMVDFNGNTDQNRFLGDKSGGINTPPKQGLLSTNLINGYPVSALKATEASVSGYEEGKSLSTLYANAKVVDNLFIKSTYEESGYFEFDSTQNFATLIDADGNIGNEFTVYGELGSTDKDVKSSLRHGQFFPYDTITPGIYTTKNPENLYDALGNELSKDDPRKYERLHLVENPNYYNGMELGASFVQTPDGKDSWGHDIIFEFTGDDDFWLYVDDELVIDLGGIHSALAGNVNFATGDVTVNGEDTNLREVFENNYIARNPGASSDDIKAYLDNYFEEGENKFKNYSSHTMKIFYMERGAGASNLYMRFNMSYVSKGHVTLKKEVTGSDDIDFDMVEYPYQVYYKETEDGEEILLDPDDENVSVTYQNSAQKVEFKKTYTPPGCAEDVSFSNVFFLSPDKIVEIHFPSDAIYYRVIECGINTEVYSKVLVNKEDITGQSISITEYGAPRSNFDSGLLSVKERPNVVFENQVDPAGLRTLTFSKKLYDEEGYELHTDPALFNFRLYLSNGVDDTLYLADSVKYCVKNPQGFLCKWDSAVGGFAPTTYMDLSELDVTDEDTEEVAAQKAADKASITFKTSVNGQISQIPAWYSVLVPNLPVGVRFKVLETYNDTPLGYGRTEYYRKEGTYKVEDGDNENTGRIRYNESPQIDVLNKRGYGIETKKIWSDKNYTKKHETIYLAVFIGNSTEPVPGTVRALDSKNTNATIRYFFEDLEEGHNFEDYHVREVKLTDPGDPDDDGVISTYSSIEIVDDGAETQIKAVSSGSDEEKSYTYKVSYSQGVAEKSIEEAPEANTRVDTITNMRKGGIVLTLYDMKTNEVLSGGTFTLQEKTGENTFKSIGTFTSDSSGRITILYDCKRDTDYLLTQTKAPKGYIGLPNEITFTVDVEDNITIDPNGNGDKWQSAAKCEENSELLIAKVDVFNKPYTLQVYKYDDSVGEDDGQLSGAKFALYRGVKSGLAGVIKDGSPMTGYESLITEQDGLIPNINTDLAPGTYYLTELAPPTGYTGMDGDVVFEITNKDGIRHISSPANSAVELSESELEDEYKYLLKIPNVKDEVKLTITKTVTGNMGNKSKDFTFTFTTHSGDSTAYKWEKSGDEQSTKLMTGGTFTLSHGEEVVIYVPGNTMVTISEDAENYTSSFKLDNEDEEQVASKTFTLKNDRSLAITNTLGAEVPTGIWLPIGILLVGAAAIGLAIFSSRRRIRKLKKYEEDT